MPLVPDAIRARIDDLFTRNFTVAPGQELIVSTDMGNGKLYEAYILGIIAERLVVDEGLQLVLQNGNSLWLKSSHGPINRDYPGIDVFRNGTKIAEIWTDVEFITLGYDRRGGNITSGDYHEIDIIMVEPGCTGRPNHDQVMIAVECKNQRDFKKALLREALGVRRELSYFQVPTQTGFVAWPHATVPATPPSCFLVFSSSEDIQDFVQAGHTFGIDFIFQLMA